MEKENGRMRGQVSQDSLYLIRNLFMDIHGLGGDNKEKRLQEPTMCGQLYGSTCLMHRNATKSKNGPSRNHNSLMPEDDVVLSFLNLMMRN